MFDLKDCFGLPVEKRELQKKEVGIKKLYESLPTFSLFCTPGHKGELCKRDVTEWDGGKLFPCDSIDSAQKTVAKHYGVKQIRFLVGGASMGVKASVLAVDGDIIAPTFSHKCLFEGLALAKRKAITFSTETDENGLPSLPTACDYEKAIIKNESAKAIFVTSPDYFGRTANVSEIKSVAEKYGKLLIVDCAHGAHFASRPDLFPVGAEKKADFAVLSAHKTLRSYTQSAFGVCNNDEYLERYDYALTLLSTTSPSYLLLSSLEEAIEYEKENASVYDTLVKSCNELRKNVKCLKNDDPLRLNVECNDAMAVFNGAMENGIMPETYYGRYCVFIVTLSDNPEKIERLKKVLRRIIK